MFSKIIRVFGVFVTAILLACIVYFGKLYSETTPAFESLRPEISNAATATPAELFISDVLFDEAKKSQAKPADFIARTKLNAQPRCKMINYHIKGHILARRLNRKFGDEQILGYWLSSVYFGAGEYGLELAAQSLFNKNTNALSQDELISLATLIRHPSLRSDRVRWEKEKRKLEDSLNAKREP